MCGIVGFNWEDVSLIRGMAKALVHRGPDDSGFFTSQDISLGHRRLSILDLSVNGRQPMFNENKNIVITFNGEIYNFLALKKDLLTAGHTFSSDSDTEVIIHGYEEYGDAICSKLEGMFAFALWDMKKRKLLLARDRMGKKPLYYYQDGKKLIFASEIKAILEHPIPRKINLQCFSDYLSLRFSPGNSTMFLGIEKLPPGHYAVYQRGKLTLEQYWTLPSLEGTGKGKEEEVDSLIARAVQKRLMADVPLGVFLSGGLDSSAIVAYMSRFVPKIKTFSVGFGDSTDETRYAEMIAERFHTDHRTIHLSEDILKYLPDVVWHFDEPLADPAALPTYLLAQEVSQEVKVALSGEGGDEVFGGYDSPTLLPKVEKWYLKSRALKNIGSWTSHKAASLFGYPKKQQLMLASEMLKSPTLTDAYKKLFYLPFTAEDKQKILMPGIIEKVKLTTIFDTYLDDENKLYEGTYDYYFKEWLSNDLLMKADKMSMAHGLEVRNPFLDIQLVEYFAHLSPEEKHKRALFRRTVGKLLPEEIMQKKKQGFTLPLSRWFTQPDIVERIKPHLEDLGKRNYFQLDAYKEILDHPENFRNDHRLWVLLNFELWHKLYLDKVPLNSVMV